MVGSPPPRVALVVPDRHLGRPHPARHIELEHAPQTPGTRTILDEPDFGVRPSLG